MHGNGVTSVQNSHDLRLRLPILVIKDASKVDDRVGDIELIIKLKPKDVKR